MIKGNREHKGPYPLGDIGVIGSRSDCRWLIRCLIRWPILSLITLWVWPIHWASGKLITGQPPAMDDGETADLYQAYLMFHWQLVARRQRYPVGMALYMHMRFHVGLYSANMTDPIDSRGSQCAMPYILTKIGNHHREILLTDILDIYVIQSVIHQVY